MFVSISGNLGSWVIIVVTVAVSLAALYVSPGLMEKCIFRPHEVAAGKNLDSLYMCGFVHGSLGHLLFNMFSFWFFSFSLERHIGTAAFIGLYFVSLVASMLPDLYRHRDNPAYASLGASGAVCAIIFAYIIYFPGASLFLLMLPIPIPAPIFAIGYVAYSWYSARTSQDNINHGAHLSGALFGVACVVLLDFPAWENFVSRLLHIIHSI